MNEHRRVRILALAWVLTAIGLTVLMGPHLGLRGWAWLGLHHLVMTVTIVAEGFRRARQEPG